MKCGKWKGMIKRAIAGVLVVGMITTGMPAFDVEAANELPIQTQPGEETETKTGTPENPSEDQEPVTNPEDIGSGEQQPGEPQPDDETKEEPAVPDPGTETEDEETDSDEEEAAEEEDELQAVYTAQVSGNDISGNDLMATMAVEEENRVVGGYIALPEDWDVSVVDESAPITNYTDDIAPLMADSTPSEYIPSKGALPLTRNQNPYGTCWAHSAMALAEIGMIKKMGTSEPDFSELHLVYFSYHDVEDPLGGLNGDHNSYKEHDGYNNFVEGGGNLALAQYVLADWVGAANEETLPYSDAESLKSEENEVKASKAFDDVAHLQNIFNVNLNQDRDTAKKLLQEYGGLGASYYDDIKDDNKYFNDDNLSYYCYEDKNKKVNHAITIVGWDDNFNASKFGNSTDASTRPSLNGAWLVRNSWEAGADANSRGRSTYFWLSYYDKSLADAGYAFDFEGTDNYDNNYQYDGSMHSAAVTYTGDASYAANVFTVQPAADGKTKAEQLKAVGLMFYKAQTPYTISIYKNPVKEAVEIPKEGGSTEPKQLVKDPTSGTLVAAATTSGTCACEGFYTVPLKTPVTLMAGDTFSVVVKYGAPASDSNKVYLPVENSTTGSFYSCTAALEQGQSFIKESEGSSWGDMIEVKGDVGNLRIKAYTSNVDSTVLPTGVELSDDMKADMTDNVLKLAPGVTYEASCNVLPAEAFDQSVTWTSSNTDVAAVDPQTGLITAKTAGDADITIACVAAPEVTKTFKVQVSVDLQGIAISGLSSVTVGGQIQLRAEPNPSSASLSGLQWSSDDPDVLTVDNNGTVTGVNPGYATVTATVGTITNTTRITCSFPPVNCEAQASREGIRITWQGNAKATKYELYRVDGETWTQNGRKLKTTISTDMGSLQSYLDIDVTVKQSYTYRVIATVPYKNGSESQEETINGALSTVTMPAFYTITYVLNGGTNASGNLTEYNSSADDFQLKDPTRMGYAFEGWYTEETFTNKVTSLSASTVTGDMTLYANWTPDSYKITYENLNGGIHENPSTYTVETPKIMLKEANKPGYVFVGWYSDAECTDKITEIATDGCKDITIYAKWNCIHTITYILYGGTNDSENPSTYTADDANIVLKAATKSGTTFEGWYRDSQYQNQVEKIEPDKEDHDIILFAKWEGEAAPTIESIQIGKRPTRTTFKKDEDLDVSGGEIICKADKEIPPIPINNEMVSGFDSSIVNVDVAKKCTVTVTFEGKTTTYDTLIVLTNLVLEEPAYVGQKLSELKLPENEYGAYVWANPETTLTAPAPRDTPQEEPVSFIPADQEAFQTVDHLVAQIVVENLTEGSLEAADITVAPNLLYYTGMEQKPPIILAIKGVPLVEGQDYKVTYKDNINAGEATVTAEGCGDYSHSSKSTHFEIKKAGLQVRAEDKTILIGDPIPTAYDYEVDGLLVDDHLITEPTFGCDIATTDQAGQFVITPAAADAGPNYEISYEPGCLTVASEYIAYSVTFDTRNLGTAPAAISDIRAGSTIEEPEQPTAEGYQFAGWYKDAACTKAWNFDVDIVQSNLTLYAKWLRKSAQSDNQFQIQKIEDIYYYTGRAQKPAVNVYDGETLLRAGWDYTIKYVNNINANAGGVWTKGNGQGADFNSNLPYVQITGRGNYTDELKINFNIRPVKIVDEKGNPAEKVALRYTDQLVTGKKEVKPFQSIKCSGTMKLNRDYTLTLEAVNTRDDKGQTVLWQTEFTNAAVPAGYTGTFRLTVKGVGNYEGTINKTVYVTDKLHLMKNARITLGKNQKNVELAGRNVKLTPSTQDSADTFTVKFGKTVLTPNQDYTVSYKDNDKVGRATLIITGAGDYAGTKTITFNVMGKAFSARTVTVTGIENKVYTGRAITQNQAALVYNAGKPDEKPLQYGTDYTISYARNINRGTAIMTFTGTKKAGFSGSVRKSFKITADDIEKVSRAEGWNTIAASYSKAGARPDAEIVLTNAGGIPLQKGKDYTLSYQNNRRVAKSTDEEAPTIIVRGRGNYQGRFSIPFTIASADLSSRIKSGEITVKTSVVAYHPNYSDDYAYQPAVKLTEGRHVLRPNVDYTLTYQNNTQEAYKAYIESAETAADGSISYRLAPPQVIINAGSSNTYVYPAGVEKISVPLRIYRHRLTRANLRVELRSASECIYTGTQVTPEDIVVSYKDENGKWTVLKKETDYTVSYGTNLRAGKNTGRITISGVGTLYGGNVTVAFDIQKKKIQY